MPAALAQIEPPLEGYRLTLEGLKHYQELARAEDGPAVPVPAKTVAPGGTYAGTAALSQRLTLLGDLPAGTQAPAGELYEGALVEGVTHFQQRHGLTPDGRLGAQTVKALNVPIATRVQQLRLALERWRWIRRSFPSHRWW